MTNRTLFSAADVCLPKLPLHRTDEWTKWAVIACDQFTSDVSYWENASQIRKGSASALDLVLPEAYLGTDEERPHKEQIARHMAEMDFTTYPDSMVWIERKLPDGRVRQGILGKLIWRNTTTAWEVHPPSVRRRRRFWSGSRPAVRFVRLPYMSFLTCCC